MKKTYMIVSMVLMMVLQSWGQTTPNILFILTDDHGYADVGFNNGSADIATPNLDALAATGTKFTSAYVTHPFCGPSRASIMTGRYPHVIGAQFNISDNDYNSVVDTNEAFVSEPLKTAGYNTGMIGKWHLGRRDNFRPNDRGFDYFYGFLNGGHTYTTGEFQSSNRYSDPLVENEGLANESNGLYTTDLLSDKGVEFINNTETNDAEPFFLFMSYNAPHTPLVALQSDKDALTSAPYSFTYSDDDRHTYAAMVYAFDRGVKKLVDALTANGELNNTLIVFMSDNGGRTDRGALNTPLRGVKGDTFEGGFRVPMFMTWPGGNIPAGGTYSHNVSSLDLYPTFVNVAGGTVAAGKQLDGKDILTNVINSTNARSGESIYAVRHRAANSVGIIRDNLKAHRFSNSSSASSVPNGWSLFDLDTNIEEDQTQNISSDAENQEKLNEMVFDAYQWSLTHIEPQFFDSTGAESTWNTNHSNTNSGNATSWQDVLFGSTYTVAPPGVDVVKPVITLIGGDLTQEEGGSYTDAGATATDETDGDLTSSIVVGGDTVDPNTPGVYNITYDVSDAAGNNATQIIRTITITVEGSGNASVVFDSTFDEVTYDDANAVSDLNNHSDWIAGHFNNATATWTANSGSDLIQTGANFAYSLLNKSITATNGDLIITKSVVQLGTDTQIFPTTESLNFAILGLNVDNIPNNGAGGATPDLGQLREGVQIQLDASDGGKVRLTNPAGTGSFTSGSGEISQDSKGEYEIVVEYTIGANAESSSKIARIKNLSSNEESTTSVVSGIRSQTYDALTSSGAYYFNWGLNFVSQNGSDISVFRLNNLTISKNDNSTLSSNEIKKTNISDKVSPKIVSTTLNIVDVETEKYKVLNIAGSQVLEADATGVLDVSGLASGVYILVTDEGFAKFVKL